MLPYGPVGKRTSGPLSERVRRWRLPVGLTAALVTFQAAGWTSALEYRRSSLLRGQVWRLVTGSFVHLGWIHLGRDALGLLLIWGLLSQALDESAWLGALLVSALAVGLGLLAFSPQIAWYVGISGPLFGLFCAGALVELPDHPLHSAALLLGMGAVIGWTLHAGALPGETRGLGGKVVPQAHLYGAIGGAIFVSLRSAMRARRASARHRPLG